MLVVLGTSAFAQTAIPQASMLGEITTFPTEPQAGQFSFTMSVTDFSGKFNGTDVTTTDKFVVWRNCNRYPVIAIASQFSGEITITVSNPDNAPNMGLGFAAILDETDIADNGFFIASGGDFTLQSLNQCMGAYYAEEQGGGVGITTVLPGENVTVDSISVDSVRVNAVIPKDTAYSISSANVDADVVSATGAGITLTENGNGELTVFVPTGVELEEFNIYYPSSVTNSSSLYVIFDYEGQRSYNTSRDSVRPFIIRQENGASMDSPNRTVPDFGDGSATSKNYKYGVSAYGGGDGSDLEMTILNAPQGTNTWANFKQ